MKNILITGANGDLGSSIARKFAQTFKSDCSLILHYNKNSENLSNLVTDLSKVCSVETFQCDFTNEENVNEFGKALISKYGKIDILINNAAFAFDGELCEHNANNFINTLKVNLVAPFVLMKELGTVMNKEKCGKIINIASTNGIDYNCPYSLSYDASKAGLINLTKNMAIWFKNVNVNCVCPHWIDTNLNQKLDPDYLSDEANKIIKGE